MQSVKYLEKVREKYQLKTDAALAEKIGVGKSAMSHYMKGTRVMDEETCLSVALVLEIDPARVLMAAGMDRAEKTGQKSLWEVFSKRMAATAASAILAVAATLFLSPTQAEAAPALKPQGEQFTLCKIWRCFKAIMSAVATRLKGLFFGAALQPAAS